MANLYAQYGTTAEVSGAPVAKKKKRRNAANNGWEWIGPEDELADGSDAGYMSAAHYTKLEAVEASATADQTGAEVKSLYEAEADTNAFTDALSSKLTGIEAAADVTDFANVLSSLAAASSAVGFNSQKITGLGAPSASTDAVTKNYVDTAVAGHVLYQGTWNASTNSPSLSSGSGTQGYYYKVATAGSTALDGISEWAIGDWAIYNGSAWEKVDNTDQVTSVAGKDGVVTLDTDDVSEGSNLYYTEVRVSANSDVAANTSAKHTHSNSAVLDATTASFLIADESKLDGIEAGATGDLSGSEIATLYEAENDKNAFTDADHSKLDGIESGATADLSGSEIATLYEAESDKNAFTDALLSKLNGCEASSTADQTGSEIATAYEGESDRNQYSDAEKAKLAHYGAGLSGTVQTTDATVTVVASHTPSDNTVVTLHCVVSGRKSDGSQGAGYTVMGTFRRSGGTTTQIGSTTVLAQAEDDADWDATFAVSGSAAQVKVTGKAATTIDWRSRGYVIEAP